MRTRISADLEAAIRVVSPANGVIQGSAWQPPLRQASRPLLAGSTNAEGWDLRSYRAYGLPKSAVK
jgi:hypothetical protein